MIWVLSVFNLGHQSKLADEKVLITVVMDVVIARRGVKYMPPA